MAGRFKVFGMFRVTVRNRRRLIIYGDILEGFVRNGEALLIPLNSSLTVTAAVESVEAIDGTKTGSHVALVVDTEDQQEVEVIQGLNVIGETLEISASRE